MTAFIRYLQHIMLMVFVLCSENVFAESGVHVRHHLEKGVKNNFFVSGLIENKGNENIYQGYITITPMTKNCYPLSPRIWSFGGIKIKKRLEFKIPIRGNVNSYKLDVAHAMNSFGDKILIADKTYPTMDDTHLKHLEKCKRERIYHH